MGIFRNPELKKHLLIQVLILVVLTLVGFSRDSFTGVMVLLSSSLMMLTNVFFTFRRYSVLAKLTDEIDEVLHKDVFRPISMYEEGELSILSTQIHKMNKRLEEQKSALLHDKVYLSESLADISHQIRTPLTALNLTCDLLLDEDLQPGRRKSLVKEQMKLLDQIDWLISALLKLAKLDARTANMAKEKVLVKDLLRRATEPLGIAMEIKEQELSVTMSGEESYMGDIYWSTEALLNVLKNSMEHTERGGRISLEVSENVLYTEIIIRDNGPGIQKEDLPHLFERFYKGKSSSHNSVGIGLALARMIITQQGGTIKAENNKDQGAKFTIRFYGTNEQERESAGL